MDGDSREKLSQPSIRPNDPQRTPDEGIPPSKLDKFLIISQCWLDGTHEEERTCIPESSSACESTPNPINVRLIGEMQVKGKAT